MTMSDSRIRVMIVDDHDMVRSGLELLISGFEDLDLIGQASNAAEALSLCGEDTPDVVLMDMIMPGMDGVEATRTLRERHPNVQVIALTSFKDKSLVHSALQAGAIGYLLKNVSVDELATAIRTAHAGKPTLAPEATQAIIDSVTNTQVQRYDLTSREIQVLELMVEGLTNAQIAQRLSISRSTVKAHASNIFLKLGVASRTEAVSMALQQDLIN